MKRKCDVGDEKGTCDDGAEPGLGVREDTDDSDGLEEAGGARLASGRYRSCRYIGGSDRR